MEGLVKGGLTARQAFERLVKDLNNQELLELAGKHVAPEEMDLLLTAAGVTDLEAIRKAQQEAGMGGVAKALTDQGVTRERLNSAFILGLEQGGVPAEEVVRAVLEEDISEYEVWRMLREEESARARLRRCQELVDGGGTTQDLFRAMVQDLSLRDLAEALLAARLQPYELSMALSSLGAADVQELLDVAELGDPVLLTEALERQGLTRDNVVQTLDFLVVEVPPYQLLDLARAWTQAGARRFRTVGLDVVGCYAGVLHGELTGIDLAVLRGQLAVDKAEDLKITPELRTLAGQTPDFRLALYRDDSVRAQLTVRSTGADGRIARTTWNYEGGYDPQAARITLKRREGAPGGAAPPATEIVLSSVNLAVEGAFLVATEGEKEIILHRTAGY